MFALDKPLVWILIFLIVVLLFGVNKIPELGKGLGRSIREFKEETQSATKETKDGVAVVKETITDVKAPVDSTAKVAVGTTTPAVKRTIIEHPDGRREITEETIQN